MPTGIILTLLQWMEFLTTTNESQNKTFVFDIALLALLILFLPQALNMDYMALNYAIWRNFLGIL